MADLEGEYQALEAELQGLNEALGLNPQDGLVPESSEQLDLEYEALQRELASFPMTREEYAIDRKAKKARTFTEDLGAFATGLGEGASMMGGQAVEAAKEVPWYWWTGVGALYDYETLGETLKIGAKDFSRFAKTLGSAAMDKLGDYDEEEEIDREYTRYLDDFEYQTKTRPKMLESDAIEYKAFADFGSNFVDPFVFVPVAGWTAKGASVTAKGLQKAATAGAVAARSRGLVKAARGAEFVGKQTGRAGQLADIAGKIGAYPSKMAAQIGRKGLKGTAWVGSKAAALTGKTGEITAKVAGAPRKLAASVVEKIVPQDLKGIAGAGPLWGQLFGGITGTIPGAAELGIAELVGTLGGKIGKTGAEVLNTFSQRGGKSRFLYRLATNEKIPIGLRKKAMLAYNLGGTRAGDMAFNSLVNGTSVGALNAAFAGLAGQAAEDVGAAAGAGLALGGVMPFGQPGMVAGKTPKARSMTTIDNHMKNRLTAEQREQFKRFPEASKVLLATMHEANIGAPKVIVLPKEVYLDSINEPGRRDRHAYAHFEDETRTIYVNDASLSLGAKEASEILAHEVGHDFVKQSLGNDAGLLQLLLEEYKVTPEEGTPFHFRFDQEGNGIGDPIYLDERAVEISKDYDRRLKAIGRNASALAQEIGADQFSMMFSANPNVFEQFHPGMRRHLIDAARKVLGISGKVDLVTGNPLDVTISKKLEQLPGVKKLFKNYGKARSFELLEKGQNAEKGVLIEPRKGQLGEDRYTELFGGVGLSLKDAKNLSISDNTLFRELKAIQEIYRENAPEGWNVTKHGWLEGKALPDDLRTIFTRNDTFGNVANILDALQEAISQRIGIRFGYRSGRKGNYQNPFRIRDVAIYGWQVSPVKKPSSPKAKRQSRPSLKVLGYNQEVVKANVDTLVQKGYIKDPRKFFEEFSAQAQKALEDPEGRINPEGRRENEIMAVAFGLKESAPQIASPGLRDLLESGTIKKSFVSFDVEALAGLTKGRDAAFAFDYTNIRDNYSPHRDFIPSMDHETVPLPFIEDLGGEDAAAGFRRVATDTMRKAEYERFQKGITEKEQFEAMGNQPRFPQGEKLYMPGDGTVKAKGDEVVRLDPETLRLFMPASEKVNLQDYADRRMMTLTSDQLGLGEMSTGPKGKKKVIPVKAQGGRGFMHIFNGGGWGFKGKGTATTFMNRIREVAGGDDSVLVGITVLGELNHLNSPYGQLAYANALRAAIDTGMVPEATANSYIKTIMARILESKADKAPKGRNRKVLEGIKGFSDFEKAVKAKEINFALAPWIYKKAAQKTLPIKEAEALEMGIDLATVAKDIADPELVGTNLGDVVAILEVPVTETPKKTDFHYSYPYTIEGKKIGFLKEFANVRELTSDPRILNQRGVVSAHPLMNVMPQLDLLPSKQFMPASEAGATKTKKAEALKLWQEKGTDSPYFKKWFAKSMVVDENGDPLPLYRGTTRVPKPTGWKTTGGRATPSFTSVPEVASLYAHEPQPFGYIKPKGSVSKVYMKMENPLDLRKQDVRTTLDELLVNNWDFPDNFYPDSKEKKHFRIRDLERLLYDIGQLEDKNYEIDVSHWTSDWRIDEPFEVTSLIENLRQMVEDGEMSPDDFVTDIYGILGEIKIDQYSLADSKSLTNWAKKAGHDGIIHNDTVMRGAEFFPKESVAGKPAEKIKGIDTSEGDFEIAVWRPFDNKQIKSATGNRGTFDPSSPDIQFMPASSQPRQAPRPAARQAPQGNRFMAPAAAMVGAEAPLERFMGN